MYSNVPNLLLVQGFFAWPSQKASTVEFWAYYALSFVFFAGVMSVVQVCCQCLVVRVFVCLCIVCDVCYVYGMCSVVCWCVCV